MNMREMCENAETPTALYYAAMVGAAIAMAAVQTGLHVGDISLEDSETPCPRVRCDLIDSINRRIEADCLPIQTLKQYAYVLALADRQWECNDYTPQLKKIKRLLAAAYLAGQDKKVAKVQAKYWIDDILFDAEVYCNDDWKDLMEIVADALLETGELDADDVQQLARRIFRRTCGDQNFRDA